MGDPLRSDDNYQNLGALPHENMNPGAGGAPPPPVGGDYFAAAAAPPPPAPAGASDKGPGGAEVGAGVQELPDSDPSDTKRPPRIDKAKVKKLRKKIKRAKIIVWAMIALWVLVLILFILVHLNTFGIHVLPFLVKVK
uniref:Uncharacterized protein n=1 Tax=Caenorhabditis tropicalis TaxID=1561998 RepID=A0A1I7UE83_9PELO